MMTKRFNRYELKYLIHSSQQGEIEADLQCHMAPDPLGAENGSYRVTSLYYDSVDLKCFRSKVDGLNYRRKLRVRLYGDYVDADLAMVEIKQRINRTIAKRRVALPLGEALALCEGSWKKKWDDQEDAAVADEVKFLVRALDLKPTCVISYLRRAYVGGPYDQRLRVTFDTEMSSRVPPLVDVGAADGHFFIPPDYAILEVKVDQRVPLWMCNLLSRHNCRLDRISKYCVGLKKILSLKQVAAGWTDRATMNGTLMKDRSQLRPGTKH